MAAMPANRGPYLNINTHLANLATATPLSPSYMPFTPVYTPSLARPPSPWQLPPPPPSTPVSGLSGLPPNHPYLQDYAMLVLNNITRLQQQQEEQQNMGKSAGASNRKTASNLHSSVQSMSPPKSFSGGQAGGISGHGSSGMGTSLTSPQLLSHRQGRSPRNSSPNNPGGKQRLIWIALNGFCPQEI